MIEEVTNKIENKLAELKNGPQYEGIEKDIKMYEDSIEIIHDYFLYLKIDVHLIRAMLISLGYTSLEAAHVQSEIIKEHKSKTTVVEPIDFSKLKGI